MLSTIDQTIQNDHNQSSQQTDLSQEIMDNDLDFNCNSYKVCLRVFRMSYGSEVVNSHCIYDGSILSMIIMINIPSSKIDVLCH